MNTWQSQCLAEVGEAVSSDSSRFGQDSFLKVPELPRQEDDTEMGDFIWVWQPLQRFDWDSIGLGFESDSCPELFKLM